VEGALVRRNRRPLTRRRWRRVWRSPRKERDRERQRLACDRPGGRIRHREGALIGRLSIKSLQVRAALVPLGNRGTSTATPKLGARRQARLYPRSRRSPKLRLGGRSWKPSPKAKVEGGVIRESSGSQGARSVLSVAEVGRRIFPARAKLAERRVESPQGSLTRRSFPDEENRFAVGKRVRGEHGPTNSEARANLLRPQGMKIDPTEGVLVQGCRGLKQAEAALGLTGRARRRESNFAGRPSERARSARPRHPLRDRGRQRSEFLVRLPQPMGAGGQQPPRPRKQRRPRAAPNETDRSHHG